MRLWLGSASLVLLSLPLILLMLLSTSFGTDWLLRHAVGLVQGDGIEVSFEQSRGNLLERVEIEGLHYAANGVELKITDSALAWRPWALLDRRLHIASIEADDVSLKLPPPADTAPEPLSLPDIKLPIALTIDHLQVTRFRMIQGQSGQQIDRLSLAAELDDQGLALRELQVNALQGELSGQLGLAIRTPHALTGALEVRLNESLTEDLPSDVNASVRLSGTALAPRIDATVIEPVGIEVNVALQLADATPTFDIGAHWPKLMWPLAGESLAQSYEGHLTLQGSVEDYRLTLASGIESDDFPTGQFHLDARGDDKALSVEQFSLKALKGELTATGELAWDPAIQWQFDVTMRDIDPGVYLPEWPGQLGGRLMLNGTFDTGPAGDAVSGLDVQVKIESIVGRLRGQALAASGLLGYANGGVTAQKFSLASGDNRVFIDGRVDRALDLSFDLKAPDLAALYPGLSGRLIGDGRVGGTVEVPKVNAKLDGQALSYQGMHAGELGLALDWGGADGKGAFRLADVIIDGTQIDTVDATLDGAPSAHRLRLNASLPDSRLALEAAGGLQEQIWAGILEHLQLDVPGLGQWVLQAPTTVRLGEAGSSIEQLCLAQGAASMCADGGVDDQGTLDLTAMLKQFDLALLAPLLPGDAEFRGRLDGEASITGTQVAPQIGFRLSPRDGTVSLVQDNEPIDIAYRDAEIKGRFEQDQGKAELRFALGENGKASGELTLGAEQSGQRALGGRVAADFPDLGLLTGFVPAIQAAEGRLRVEMRLGGTLSSPHIVGLLEIEDAQAMLPATGVTLRELELKVNANDTGVMQINGGLRSGEGQTQVTGTVDMVAKNGPAIDLEIHGERVEIVRLPEASVEVSPTLRLSGTPPYRLTGRLDVPRAKIELKELPSGTVAVSDDEIVVGETRPEPKQTGASALIAEVKVVLGDDVSFKGFGLRTDLRGAVDAASDTGGARLDGKIELHDGSYQAYGQDLQVERGRLLFAGPPTNPELDLRAVRDSRDGRVKAYLETRGRLQNPRFRVYSEPILPEAEALAYLLTGRGLDSAGRDEGVDIAGAALSLGISKSEPLLQDLSDRLGLDELTIDSGRGGLEDSALVLGKYLNPDLYLGYSQGLFNPEGAVLLRLRLSERLELESRSGNEQSADLLYRIEHD